MATHGNTWQHTAAHCNTRQHNSLIQSGCCSVLHCASVRCCVLLRVAMCCLNNHYQDWSHVTIKSQKEVCVYVCVCGGGYGYRLESMTTLQRLRKIHHTAHHFALQRHCKVVHSTAHHCTILYHTVPYCTILQHTAAHCTTLQHIAPHCTTLHHTAPHRTTLHHTAPHWVTGSRVQGGEDP